MPAPVTPQLACATGLFQSGVTGLLTCPAGSLISAVTAVAGGVTPAGTCGSYTVAPCTAGPGIGSVFIFSSNVTATCVGMNSCVFAAGTGAYADFCFGYPKFWYAQATCVPAYQAPASPAFSLACASGPFQSGVTGTLSCSSNETSIVSVTAIAGGSLGLFGTCGAYTTYPCASGVGTGRIFDFSNYTTGACKGLQSCTFPAGVSSTFPDYCYGARAQPKRRSAHLHLNLTSPLSPPPPPTRLCKILDRGCCLRPQPFIYFGSKLATRSKCRLHLWHVWKRGRNKRHHCLRHARLCHWCHVSGGG